MNRGSGDKRFRVPKQSLAIIDRSIYCRDWLHIVINTSNRKDQSYWSSAKFCVTGPGTSKIKIKEGSDQQVIQESPIKPRSEERDIKVQEKPIFVVDLWLSELDMTTQLPEQFSSPLKVLLLSVMFCSYRVRSGLESHPLASSDTRWSFLIPPGNHVRCLQTLTTSVPGVTNIQHIFQ